MDTNGDSGATMEQQADSKLDCNAVTMPVEPPPIIKSQLSDKVIFCQKCGQQNAENNFKCTRCGFALHGVAETYHIVAEDSDFGGLIPYKNVQALWAYYLGIFALIPCVGIFLGIAALVLGIKGLKYAELYPEAKGKVHSWIGIVLGALCVIGNVLMILMPLLTSVFIG